METKGVRIGPEVLTGAISDLHTKSMDGHCPVHGANIIRDMAFSLSSSIETAVS